MRARLLLHEQVVLRDAVGLRDGVRHRPAQMRHVGRRVAGRDTAAELIGAVQREVAAEDAVTILLQIDREGAAVIGELADRLLDDPLWRNRAHEVVVIPDAVRWHINVAPRVRSEEHTSELQSHVNLVCRLLLEKKKKKIKIKK